MTNKEFIHRLRLAKVEALKLWPSEWCIVDAALLVFKVESWERFGSFGAGTRWRNYSSMWVRNHAKSPDDIARVFDESIRALGGKP